MNANLYANFLPLILLLLTIGYGAAAVAGEEEAQRLDLVVSLPFSRRRIVTEKAATMVGQAAIVSVATYLCMLVGRAFDLDLDAWNLATTTFGLTLLTVGFGLVALTIGAAAESGERRSASRARCGRRLSAQLPAPVVSWLDPWKVLSPFYWAVGNNQLTNGLGWGGLLVLLALTAGGVRGRRRCRSKPTILRG